MRQNHTSNARAIIAAAVVVGFVTLSSYLYINMQSIVASTSTNADQNLTSISQSLTNIQNTTTYSSATVTSQPSTVTITPANATVSIQTVTQGPPEQNFGNNYFEPPSGILISADTLVWMNFQLNASTYGTNAEVGGTINLFPFPDATGVNVTVAVYLNGALNVSSTTPLMNINYGINSSLIPSSTTPNSIFALSALTPVVGMGTQTGMVNLKGTTITIAVSSDKSIWLAGWTKTDMAAGTGPQFGLSTGQLSGTYEATETGTSLPSSLPTPTTTLTFELQMPGNVIA